jgi:hypothetical protein
MEKGGRTRETNDRIEKDGGFVEGKVHLGALAIKL